MFCFVAYIAGNLWYYYLVALSGALFLISTQVGQGIHEKGIYYQSIGVGKYIIKLAKWEDIKELKFDQKNNILKSFKLKNTRIHINHPGKYENLDNIYELENFLYD